MQKHPHIRQVVRFRGWSRKGYAVFISLGRLVTIGCLGKSVTEIALRKQKGGAVQTTYRQPATGEPETEESSGGWPEPVRELLLCLLPQVAADATCGGAERTNIINRYVQRGHTDSVGRQPVRVSSFFVHE